MTRHVCFFTVLLTFAASLAGAQSLAEVARKEEARRQTVKHSSKVYTNKDLKPAARWSGAPPAQPPTSEPAVSGEKAGEKPEAAESQEEDARAKDEQQWRARMAEARTALEDALAVNGRSGERVLEAHTLAALGDVAQETGRFDAALEYFDASLSIRRQLNDRRGEGWMLHHLARTRALMGHAAAAAALFDDAARIAVDCGDAALRRGCERGEE